MAKAQSAITKNNEAEAQERVALRIAEYQTDYYRAVYVEKTVSVNTEMGDWIAQTYQGETIYAGDYEFQITGASAPYKVTILKNNRIKDNIIGKMSDDGKTTWPKTTPGGGSGDSGEDSGNDDEQVVPTVLYTVTYNANGGTGSVPVDVEYKEGDSVDVDFVTVPSHDQGTFIGWALSENAREATYTSGGTESFTMGTTDVTLYAVYEYTQAYNSQHPELHIPTGFQYKTGTVATGYVITDAANPTDDNGNEFVWIPVASSTDYAKKAGTNNYYMTSSGGNSTEISEMVQGDVLGVSEILGENVTATLDANLPEAELANNAGGFWVGRYEAGIPNAEHENIAGYSGWTGEQESAESLKTYWDGKIANIKVKQDCEPVRNITQENALSIANGWKSGTAGNGTVAFQSGLITGAQWDIMCDFIDWETCDSDCLSWGNYGYTASTNYTGYHSDDCASNWFSATNVIKNGTGSNRWIFPTGIFVTANNVTTMKKNIFDVAGNVWEWTTEVPYYNTSHRVGRGGGAHNDDSNHNAACRRGNDTATLHANWDIGFRIVLYVK